MQYRLQSTLDVPWATRQLSRLLGADLCVRGIELEESGYSGGVYRFIVRPEGQGRIDFVLKRVPDANVFRFYEDVLAPYDLNSPRMLGTFHKGRGRDREHFIVMEYIPHEEPDWADFAKYRRAVDWLAHRDQLLERHLEQIAELDYIEPFALPPFEAMLARTREAVHDRLDPLLTDSLLRALESAGEQYYRADRALRHGPQTVTHNDFQMLNLLFGTEANSGELYVVDWTYPAIGSVCIDLATLVHVSPPELRQKLIHQYLAARSVPDFPSVFSAAQLHVHLSVLQWIIDALQSGQRHAVHRPKLREIVEQLTHDAAERAAVR